MNFFSIRSISTKVIVYEEKYHIKQIPDLKYSFQTMLNGYEIFLPEHFIDMKIAKENIQENVLYHWFLRRGHRNIYVAIFYIQYSNIKIRSVGKKFLCVLNL